MNQFNFGSTKAIKYFLKNYSNLIELKQRGNQYAVEVLTDFETLLGKTRNKKIIMQYMDIESGNMDVSEKVKYFNKDPLEIVSSKSRISLEKAKELFERELLEIVGINGEEEFDLELPIYTYKDTECKKKVNKEYSEKIKELKIEEKMIREKIENETDSKKKKNLINMKKEITRIISDEYEKEGIYYKTRKSNSIKKNQVIYGEYIDNVAENFHLDNNSIFNEIDDLAKNTLTTEDYKIFSLYYIINLTQEEISEIIDIKQSTISKKIKKINKDLKKKI